MKLLENSQLEALSSALSRTDCTTTIATSIESYSCKMTSHDKKNFKEFRGGAGQSDADGDVVLSPDEATLLSRMPYGSSPLGMGHELSSTPQESAIAPSLDNVCSRRTLFYLISTLNEHFPGHDYSDTRPEDFCKQTSLDWVVSLIDNHFFLYFSNTFVSLKDVLWKTMIDEICLMECEVYSYKRPFSFDGDEWGCLSINYLFYNCRLRRVLLLISRVLRHDDSSQLMDDPGNMTFEYED